MSGQKQVHYRVVENMLGVYIIKTNNSMRDIFLLKCVTVEITFLTLRYISCLSFGETNTAVKDEFKTKLGTYVCMNGRTSSILNAFRYVGKNN